jgi:biopolymer transport protein ExbB
MERSLFWCRLVLQEKQVVREVLTAAKVDLQKAEIIAERAGDIAIGRFLIEPLRLIRFRNLSPESIHLAIKAAWDKELVEMRKGDVLLESIIVISPLLGILGTASGLITAFTQLRTGAQDFSAFYSGVAQALITSTTGIAIAIFAFVFFRIFWILRSQQIDFFSQVGNELELIYLQLWYKPSNSKIPEEKNQTSPNSNYP